MLKKTPIISFSFPNFRFQWCAPHSSSVVLGFLSFFSRAPEGCLVGLGVFPQPRKQSVGRPRCFPSFFLFGFFASFDEKDTPFPLECGAFRGNRWFSSTFSFLKVVSVIPPPPVRFCRCPKNGVGLVAFFSGWTKIWTRPPFLPRGVPFPLFSFFFFWSPVPFVLGNFVDRIGFGLAFRLGTLFFPCSAPPLFSFFFPHHTCALPLGVLVWSRTPLEQVFYPP